MCRCRIGPLHARPALNSRIVLLGVESAHLKQPLAAKFANQQVLSKGSARYAPNRPNLDQNIANMTARTVFFAPIAADAASLKAMQVPAAATINLEVSHQTRMCKTHRLEQARMVHLWAPPLNLAVLLATLLLLVLQ
jgi:hypothetical protein